MRYAGTLTSIGLLRQGKGLSGDELLAAEGMCSAQSVMENCA